MLNILPIRRGENDPRLELSSQMLHIMAILGFTGFRILSRTKSDIRGDSWEMAGVCAMLGMNGVFSGTLVSYANGKAFFGIVRGTKVKKGMVRELITHVELPMVSVSSD